MINLISNGSLCDIGVPKVFVDSYGSRDINLVVLYQSETEKRISRPSCYWRLTGCDGGQLFSIEVKGGVIVAAELALYRSDQVIVREFSDVSKPCDLESTPVFEFELENSGPAVDVKGSCIDIARDFSVGLHGSRLRVSWFKEAPSRVLSVGSQVVFELSSDGVLGAVAFVVPDPEVVKSVLLTGMQG